MIELWMTFIGLSISFSYLPQVYKLWRNKSCENISIIMWAVILFAQVNWLGYSFYISSPSLFISNIFGVIFNSIQIMLILKYRYK